MQRHRDFTVLTTMNRRILEATGRAMLCSVIARWPRQTRIIVQYEKEDDADVLAFAAEVNPSVEVHDLLSEEPDLVSFNRRNRARSRGNLRYAATRFSFKSFAITGAQCLSPDEVLVWLDADTLTYANVTEKDISSWMPDHAALSYLGRQKGYTETGFLMMDLSVGEVYDMLDTWRGLYLTDNLFEFPQWHDCIAFDYARAKHIPPEFQHNLTPWGKRAQHVFINSPVGAHIDHMKGPRKKDGRSRVSDLLPQAPRAMRDRLSPPD